jgi:hypothetical protein
MAAWSPDKASIAYAWNAELRVAASDGTRSRRLVTAPGPVYAPRWSPDGGRVRYTVQDAGTGTTSIWEVNADGTNAYTVIAVSSGHNPCCGIWTPDARYFVFEDGGNIWALREHGLIPRRSERTRSADVRPAHLLGGDALPGWEAAVRPRGSEQGTIGPVRRDIQAVRAIFPGPFRRKRRGVPGWRIDCLLGEP